MSFNTGANLDPSQVEDVRGSRIGGRGLMVGVEFTVPDVNPIIQAGYQHGLIMINAGANVIRLVPPLVVGKGDVDNLIEKLSAILAEL